MGKFVFSWDVTNMFDKKYTVHIPFQCPNLDEFIESVVNKIRNSPTKSTLVFGCYVSESEIFGFDDNFSTLEEWFKKYESR